MRVLVACEFSGVVRDAFIARGHHAVSCDLLESERVGPHYQQDVSTLLYDGWDMMIAFPPCTYLAKSGAHLWKQRMEQIEIARRFFLMLYDAPIPHIAIENPVGWMNSHWRKPDQIIEPYWFGEPWKKQTCLWLRNLPPLIATNRLTGIRQSWVNSTNNYRNRYGEGWTNGAHRNQKERSRTFQGVAKAMAEQWGGVPDD